MTHAEADAEDHLPVYAVRLTSAVMEQTRVTFFWINDKAGIDAADAWQSDMDAVWASLATLPHRCQLAEENWNAWSPPPNEQASKNSRIVEEQE